LDCKDLIDCLRYKYENRNWGFDTVRWLLPNLQTAFNFNDISCLYNVFKGIGICRSERLTTSKHIKRFLDYYLVWYKPNNEGNRGPNIAGSVNYRFGEYVQSILNGSADNMNQVSLVIKSLGNGLENNIDIVSSSR
jgi:hypothetical protein